MTEVYLIRQNSPTKRADLRFEHDLGGKTHGYEHPYPFSNEKTSICITLCIFIPFSM